MFAFTHLYAWYLNCEATGSCGMRGADEDAGIAGGGASVVDWVWSVFDRRAARHRRAGSPSNALFGHSPVILILPLASHLYTTASSSVERLGRCWPKLRLERNLYTAPKRLADAPAPLEIGFQQSRTGGPDQTQPWLSVNWPICQTSFHLPLSPTVRAVRLHVWQHASDDWSHRRRW